jgi:Tfp pilus assembly protein PilO
MSLKPSKTSFSRRLTNQLRHPLKLRVLLSLVILAGWYFLFFSPLSDQMAMTQARIENEQKRIGIARQTDAVRKSLVPYKNRVPAKSDLNELIQYVMNRIRSSPLKLIDLKPDKAKALGPFDAISLRLTLEGTYAELDELLTWIQSEQRLLRVDSLSLTPSTKGGDKKHAREHLNLDIQLTLTSLMERTSLGKAPS